MTTTWTIAVDWDRKGDFTDTNDDITNWVIEATWFVGQKTVYQEVADNSMLTLLLNNSDGRFSPENASSPLYGDLVPLRPLQVLGDDGTERVMWQGWLESIKPTPGRYGNRMVQVLAHGPMPFYMDVETKIKLQEDKRTDEVVAELIKEVIIPPALTSAWVLGHDAYSRLGTSTYLADVTHYSDLDEGTQTLELAADNWVRQGGMADQKQDTFDVYRAIRDVTAAERGKFLFSREGKALFWNRHHLLAIQPETNPDVSLNDTMLGMDYVYAGIERMKNEIIVTCHPRAISASNQETLWELTDGRIIRVEPDNEYTLEVRYRDDSDNRIGGREVDYTDLEFEDRGAGTSDVTLTLETNANSAKLVLKNNHATLPAMVNKLRLVGQKITDQGEMDATATDQSSIVNYGRRVLRLNLLSIDDLEDAQDVADFEVSRRGQPRGDVGSIQLISHSKNGGGLHSDQLARTLGDLVRIQETQTGHNSKYWIIGEMHKLSNFGQTLKTTWYLEPATTTHYWKLGDASSKLGTNTRLAY